MREGGGIEDQKDLKRDGGFIMCLADKDGKGQTGKARRKSVWVWVCEREY